MSAAVNLDDDYYLAGRREPTGEVWLEVCGGDRLLLHEVQQRRLLWLLAGMHPGEVAEIRALRDMTDKDTGNGLAGLPRQALLASINHLATLLLGPAEVRR